MKTKIFIFGNFPYVQSQGFFRLGLSEFFLGKGKNTVEGGLDHPQSKPTPTPSPYRVSRYKLLTVCEKFKRLSLNFIFFWKR